MRIGYIISSNLTYLDVTLPVLVDSLLPQESPENILVFVGGGTEKRQEIRNGITYRWIDADAFDNNAIIGMFDYKLREFDKVFLLHDTCKAGPEFCRLTKEKLDMSADMTVVGYPGFHTAWCGFGMYNTEPLFDNQEVYEKYRRIKKGTPIDGGSFARCSTGGPYQFPGVTLNYKVSYYSNTEGPIVTEQTSVYNGAPRITEYFPGIDLYKYKANWFNRDQEGWVNVP